MKIETFRQVCPGQTEWLPGLLDGAKNPLKKLHDTDNSKKKLSKNRKIKMSTDKSNTDDKVRTLTGAFPFYHIATKTW